MRHAFAVGGIGAPRIGAPRIGAAQIDAPRIDAPRIDAQKLSALMAPGAMLIGAIGLSGLWAAVPRAATPQTALTRVLSSETSTPALRPTATQTAVLTRGQALSTLLLDLGAGDQPELALPQVLHSPDQMLAELRDAERRMISTADLDARGRLDGLRRTFRTAGLDARPYMAADAGRGPKTSDAAQTLSPMELRDARQLAARFEVDPGTARALQRTARDMLASAALAQAAAALPLAAPVDDPVKSSPFGERIDPFTGQAAFHPGQDFSGRYGEAIHATAPGVVAFVGQRSGYGNCVEVDHGHGFKTRYGHLEGFRAQVGQAVKTGDVIGLMGSTGRSTGVHLHYEVWANGRLLNPAGFLRAGTDAPPPAPPALRLHRVAGGADALG